MQSSESVNVIGSELLYLQGVAFLSCLLACDLVALSFLQAPFPMRSAGSPLPNSSLKSCTVKASLDCPLVALRMDDSLSPASLDSAAVADRDMKNEKFAHSSPINSPECLDADQASM